MPPTTRYRRGDVVLVSFRFSGETGVKQRPALVVSSDAYHRGRHEAVVAAITSNVGRLLVGDWLITSWREAGLLYPSVVTAVLRTLRRDIIARKLGELSGPDMASVGAALRTSLGLE